MFNGFSVADAPRGRHRAAGGGPSSSSVEKGEGVRADAGVDRAHRRLGRHEGGAQNYLPSNRLDEVRERHCAGHGPEEGRGPILVSDVFGLMWENAPNSCGATLRGEGEGYQALLPRNRVTPNHPFWLGGRGEESERGEPCLCPASTSRALGR